jgi:hypothetical protein
MTRRGILLVVVVVAALAVVVGAGTAAGQSAPDCSGLSYNGDGTEQNPYEVGNVDQLQCIENQGLGASYELISDIEAGETVAWNTGKGFEPIGSPDFNSPAFNGTFDGNGHTVSNLTITRGSRTGVGMFGAVLAGSSITDTRLVDVDIVGDGSVGALVGESYGGITRTYADGSVTGQGPNGGLVGYMEGTITKSASAVDVSGSGFSAGLVGSLESGSVIDSYATGNVSGEDTGGLVGFTSGPVVRSYAAGEVGSGLFEGGLAGRTFDSITNSYWDIPASGLSFSDGGTGLGNLSDTPPADEMTGEEAADNMEGFDFNFVWTTVTNPDGYPILRWQAEPTASFAYAPTNPDTGETVTFDASGSGDTDGTVVTYEWDFDGDGTVDVSTQSETVDYSYSSSGLYDATLTVTDNDGMSASTTITVEVGQTNVFTQPLPGFSNPPTNTGGLSQTLYEDVDGDGDGTSPSQAVNWWSQLVQNPQDFEDLTQEQIDALDWNGDGQLTPADAVQLWSTQVQAGT